ncbi:hypothetical protein B0T11DRAFT_271436 [Plectosphaerella cucumerina]|uniref:Myb-like domain-containing protein n=1 Tax=Plectosphaerella cucumerina TaxID=40658 RepID=A0A8K0XAA2_9PEZI|nr:hypothetical protein B0T11DRAFT_271436 [Plectosphaerella cucumerina]
MLMPSAFSCDSSQQHHRSTPHTRLQSALFASPPASPPTVANQGAIGNIFNTCRSLQSLLSTPPPAGLELPSQLPTPPLAHAPPPLKLRLRPRAPKPDGAADHLPRKKIHKRAPPRGANKRRRALDDDLGRQDLASDEDDDVESDLDISPLAEPANTEPELPPAPRTPKRARIAPEILPLGLERSDFHNIHASENNVHNELFASLNRPSQQEGTGMELEGDGELWSTEDDRILVELVLEKLKLTKTEWQDCARSLGKDRNSLSRRWRSLMSKGDIGLKGTRASRRGKLHATWR